MSTATCECAGAASGVIQVLFQRCRDSSGVHSGQLGELFFSPGIHISYIAETLFRDWILALKINIFQGSLFYLKKLSNKHDFTFRLLFRRLTPSIYRS